MRRVVVDASVAAKWFLAEPGSVFAGRLWSGEYDLHVPALLHVEVGNVLWKRTRMGELESDDALKMLRQLANFELVIHPLIPLLVSAWPIAVQYNRSVYDSLYVALAISLDCALVTADRKLFNAMRGTPLSRHLSWIENMP